MQFYPSGFGVGDPFVHRAAGEPANSDVLPEEVDVPIVGCGPAGLTLRSSGPRSTRAR